MILKDRGDFLRIDVTGRTPPSVQGAGDTEFEIEVRMSTAMNTEFHGMSWAWLDINEMKAFVKRLRMIQAGTAEDASAVAMSPKEFALSVRIYNKAKHIGVFGKLGHWCESSADQSCWSEINFGFRIEDSELKQLTRIFEDLCNNTA